MAEKGVEEQVLAMERLRYILSLTVTKQKTMYILILLGFGDLLCRFGI